MGDWIERRVGRDIWLVFLCAHIWRIVDYYLKGGWFELGKDIKDLGQGLIGFWDTN